MDGLENFTCLLSKKKELKMLKISLSGVILFIYFFYAGGVLLDCIWIFFREDTLKH